MALTANVTNPIKINNVLALPRPFQYPILVKAQKTTTLLPGEGFHVQVASKEPNQTVEIDPCLEAPPNFIQNHLQNIDQESIYVQNMSDEPIRIKKNTPICQIRETRPVKTKSNNDLPMKVDISNTTPPPSVPSGGITVNCAAILAGGHQAGGEVPLVSYILPERFTI